jgi:L-ascorbate metabolism protein UlaG (beta-lactamase superfamily)
MEITYYGHSCFSLNLGGFKVLFDPFITGNPLAAEIDINSIEADYILISHGHNDHVQDVEAIAKRTGAALIGNYEVITWFKKKGLENGHEMNLGGKMIFDFGTVKMVSAVHSSSMPDDSYGGLATGFVIESADKTFYYSGDTALFQDMRLIGDQFPIDFAFLCIGDTYTMDVADAMVAASYLNTKKVIGMHFNTWPSIEIDPVHADLIARNAEKKLILMEIGERITI